VIVTNDRERTADELERWQRAKANVENRIKEAKLGLGLDNLPSQIFNANGAYLLLTPIANDLLVWLKLLALPAPERSSYAKRLRFRFISVAGSVGKGGRRLVLRVQAGYALFKEFVEALTRIRALAPA
jgi:Transposase DDE domain group 1